MRKLLGTEPLNHTNIRVQGPASGTTVQANMNLENERSPARGSDESKGEHVSVKYTRCVTAWRWLFIFVWFFGCAAGAVWGLQGFINATGVVFTAPPGTPASFAIKAMSEAFPAPDSTPIIVLITHKNTSDHSHILAPKLKNFSSHLNQSLAKFQPQAAIVQYVTYYTLEAQGLADVVGSKFLNKGKNVTYFLIETQHGSVDGKDASGALVNYIQSEIQSLVPSCYTARVTGVTVFAQDILTGVNENLHSTETVAFPLALLVLCVMLKSFRLLIIPIVTISASLMVSFLVMYPIALSMNVVSFAPSVMSSVTLALSIDYSLFLLSRYREEIEQKKSIDDAVSLMIRFAGHTVLVSGTTIALCFLGLLAFPVPMLSSVGLGATVSIAITIVVNLTLTPALLLTFREFFSDFRTMGLACCMCSFGRDDDEVENEQMQSNLLAAQDYGSSADNENPEDGPSKMEQTAWYKLAEMIQRFRYPLILLLFAASVPFAMKIPDLELLHSFNLVVPRGSVASGAWVDLINDFGAGALISNSMLIIPPEGTSVLSQSFFDRTNSVISQINQNPALAGTTISGIMYQCMPPYSTAPNCQVEFSIFNQTSTGSSTLCAELPAICKVAETARKQFVNGTATATTVEILLPNGIDPFSPRGGDWIDTFRATLKNATDSDPLLNGYEFYLEKGDILGHDAIQKVQDLFPSMAGGVLALVFILVAVAFKSIIVPMRSVLTIGLTLAIVYGSAIFIYQDGTLNRLAVSWLNNNGKGFYWIAPVMAFSVIVGVGLDYDIFLLTRIMEFRKKGHDETTAVKLGLTKTGHIITAAGVIMAIAFSGLMMSSEMIMDQLAFLLVCAVLVDTFIVRSLIVPAIMMALDPYNFWPGSRKFAEPGSLTKYDRV